MFRGGQQSIFGVRARAREFPISRGLFLYRLVPGIGRRALYALLGCCNIILTKSLFLIYITGRKCKWSA